MGFGELLIILILILLFFGTSKLPALGAGLGRAVREFKNSMRSEPPPTRSKTNELPPDGRDEK